MRSDASASTTASPPWWQIPATIVVVVVALLCTNRSLIAALQSLLDDSTRHPLQAKQTADVIIVLGYALFRNGTVTTPLAGRVRAGVDAWRRGAASHLILSGAHPGGGLRGHVSEANAMLAYAKTLLTPEEWEEAQSKWLLEQASTSTRENALLSLHIAQEHGWSRVLVVTNTFHQVRSWNVFQKAAQDMGLQIQAFTDHVPFVGHEGWEWGLLRANVIMDHVDFWRELLALAYYKLRGFI